ncbi:SusC/RagA family TonB-linked outer membrane protein, partial [Bacteroidota bacterium]
KIILLILLFFVSFLNANSIDPKSEIISSQQEMVSITGTIVDANTGEALPGVSILVKGTSFGTITDLDGKYTIETNSDAILIISIMGYIDQEILVNNQTVIDVTLKEDVIGLEEVVVVGYGVQKKSDLTGAVASVSSEKLTEMPVIGVDQALQGRAAGVSVTPHTGMPGGEVTIQIRGISSVNGTEPLVLIDGVRGSLSDLNPGDIASIEVLKDASSAAIYGAAGGNGVIIVTTKKGEKGKITANLNYYFGQQSPWKKMDILNADEYGQAMNKIKATNGQELFIEPGETLENYDWQDIMFRDAKTQNWDFSVSGGTDKSTYFVSANYQIQEGILANSDYEKISIRANSQHSLGKIIKFGENLSFTKTKNVGYNEDVFQDEWGTNMRPILEMPPYLAPYDENGNWTINPRGDENPKVEEDVMDKEKNKYSSRGNIYVDIMPFKGLTFTSRLNAYTNFEIEDEFFKVFFYNAETQNEHSYVTKSIGQETGWEFQNIIHYERTLNDHSFELMGGYEALQTKFNDMSGRRDFLIDESPEMQYFDASNDDTLTLQIVEGGGWEQSSYATFGRLNYNFKSKYLLTVNIRKDVSSRFGPDFNSGIFPSFSVGWKFSEEQFIKNIGILSFGKLRFGYGQNGANAPGRYAYYANVSQTIDGFSYIFDGSNQSQPGATLIQMPNREMRWEAVVMTNIGLDLGLLENKINLTVDLFEKHNDGMLIYQNLPANVGMYQSPKWASALGGDARPITNIGKISNKGIDLTLGYKQVFGELSSNFDFNITFIKNEVLDLNRDSSLFRGSVGVDLKNITYTVDGHPISQFWGFETDGLFTWDDAALDENGNPYIWNQPFIIKASGDTAFAQHKAKPGDFKYVDRNNDGELDDNDKTFIGNPIPKFIFGFSTNLQYKNFDINCFFEGKFGHQLFNASKFWLLKQDEETNKHIDFLDQYHEDLYDLDGNLIFEANTDTDLPRIDPQSQNQNFTRVSDFYVENGSYVRLKNIQLGYTIPLNISEKAGVEKLRIYIGAKNLLTFTKYSGFDPEIFNSSLLEQGIERAGTYPQSKTFLIGANLQF